MLRFIKSSTNHTAYAIIPGNLLFTTNLDVPCNFDGIAGNIAMIPRNNFTTEKISIRWSDTTFLLAEFTGYYK